MYLLLLLLNTFNLSTIILINGTPYFVQLDHKFRIEAIYKEVPDYFTSSRTHQEILTDLQNSGEYIEQYAGSEQEPSQMVAENIFNQIEFISFEKKRSILNKSAVDRIRAISQKYQNGEISSITLTVHQKNIFKTNRLAQNRMITIRDLFVAYGVKEVDIYFSSELYEKPLMSDLIMMHLGDKKIRVSGE